MQPAGVKGPCEAIFFKWTFDGTKCVKFQYGGCEGNDNRFISISECEKVCIGRITYLIAFSLYKELTVDFMINYKNLIISNHNVSHKMLKIS